MLDSGNLHRLPSVSELARGMCGLYMKLGNLHKQPGRLADAAFIYVESAHHMILV